MGVTTNPSATGERVIITDTGFVTQDALTQALAPILSSLQNKADLVGANFNGPVSLLSPPISATGQESVTAGWVRTVIDQKIQEALGNPDSVPICTALPVISVASGGTFSVGQQLLGSNGTWTGANIVYSYQWVRGSTNISGATGVNYVAQAADEGLLVSLKVTATNSVTSGAITATSVGVLIGAAQLVATTPPAITGTPGVGNTLTASAAVWNLTPTTRSYQWYRNGTAISGATNQTYTQVSADANTVITFRETGILGSSTTVSVSSNSITVPASGGVNLTGVIMVLDPNATFDTLGSYAKYEGPNRAIHSNISDPQRIDGSGTTNFSAISESGITWYDNQPRLRKFTDPVGNQTCYEFTIEKGDPLWISVPRAECHWINGSGSNPAFPINQTFWWGMRFRLPDWTAINHSYSAIIAQWHIAGGTTNPWWTLCMINNRLTTVYRYNTQLNPSNNSGNVVMTSDIATSFPTNSYTTIVVRAKCSYLTSNSPGFTLWQDGVQKINYSGALGYNVTNQVPFAKVGWYPVVWEQVTVATGTRRSLNVRRHVVTTNAAYTEADIRANLES